MRVSKQILTPLNKLIVSLTNLFFYEKNGSSLNSGIKDEYPDIMQITLLLLKYTSVQGDDTKTGRRNYDTEIYSKLNFHWSTADVFRSARTLTPLTWKTRLRFFYVEVPSTHHYEQLHIIHNNWKAYGA